MNLKITKKLPLFVVTGASGVGKSTVCDILFQRESDYIVMESDLLWHDAFNRPEDGYREYRELWLRVCANISQIGKPVVLCGCTVPEQLERCDARALFTTIHYMAVVCDEEQIRLRMHEGRGISDENWIRSSVEFNQWLIDNAENTHPSIRLLDTTRLASDQAAKDADAWIMECMAREKCDLVIA